MGSNRYNQKGRILEKGKIPDYTPKEERKKAETEPTVTLSNCCVCNKTITNGYYGTHEKGGTCSKKCEVSFEKTVTEPFETKKVTSFNGSIYQPP
jgi:hypothetical protein